MGNKVKTWIEKAKQKKIVLLLSAIYSFAWSACKIVFGVLTGEYFFCVSGAYTQLFGFIKKIYLKNHASNDLEEKRGKSITISILIILSGVIFTFYMARCFFLPVQSNYNLIISITIALFSFIELGYSIYNFAKSRKSNDILLQSFRGYSLSASCMAIVLTQVALLSATQSTNPVYNGITGVILGGFSVLIGIYLLVKTSKLPTNQQLNKQ